MERGEVVLGARRRAEVNAGAGSIPKLQMAGEEVGVKVCQGDVLNLEAVRIGEREVLVDVTLRVDHNRRVRRLVADEIRGMRQTSKIELLQDHERGIAIRP